jgi:hypothetical protein
MVIQKGRLIMRAFVRGVGIRHNKKGLQERLRAQYRLVTRKGEMKVLTFAFNQL